MHVEINEDIFQEIIDAIYEGAFLNAELKKRHIYVRKFWDFVLSAPARLAIYTSAESYKADKLAAQTIEIADTDEDPQRARNRIDARKWYASKMKPEKYGDRLDLNVNQIVDIGSALAEAQARLPQSHGTLLPMSYPNNTKQRDVIDITPVSTPSNTGSKPDDPPKDASDDTDDDIFN